MIRNRLYTLIEVVGLVVSLAFVIYMGCYVWQYCSITRENPDRENIYILGMQDSPGLTYGFAELLEDRFPEMETVSNVNMGVDGIVSFSGASHSFKAIGVDRDFFRLFPYYGFVAGSPDAIEVKDNIIVSESFASRLSSGGPLTDLVGQTVTVEDRQYVIAGIIKDFKATLFPYRDIIFNIDGPLNPYLKMNHFDHFGSCIPFVKVAAGTDMNAVYGKIEALCKDTYGDMFGSGFFKSVSITRLDRIFFAKMSGFNSGDRKQLVMLAVITFLLLFSSILNYINLNSALVGKRAKEMATRQLMGASRGNVIGRYIGESLVLTAFCMVLAILLAMGIAPVMDRLLELDVPVSVPLYPGYLAGYAFLVLLVGTASALIPALLASRYRPLDIMSGRFRTDSKMLFSKVFIGIQAAMAVFMISMSIVMETQFRKAMNRPVYADTENKLFLHPGYNYPSRPAFGLADRLRELPGVREVGLATSVPGSMVGGQYSNTAGGDEIMYRFYLMDTVSFRMMDFEKVKDYGTSPVFGVWFGEGAFAATGFDDSFHDISQTLSKRNGYCGHTAGVIRDFPTNYENSGTEDWLIVVTTTPDRIFSPGWLVETDGDREVVKRQVRSLYREWITASLGVDFEPMHCDYIGNLYREALKKSEDYMRLVEIFMLISVMVSLLGLVAMSAYDAQVRTKDIAVRKVYGSTVQEEVLRGSRSYMILVLFSCIVGIPVSLWASGRYLEQFIVRIGGYGWIFAAAVLLTAAISFMSILWQTLSAARTNPADVLKKE